MTMRDGDGEQYVSLKWLVGILIAVLLSVLSGWASQRYAAEQHLAEAIRSQSDRIGVLEKVQARVLERLDGNGEKLQMIYVELKEHRSSGK